MLWDSLSEFVKTTCEGRDESHGYEHMRTVAKNSLIIYNPYRKDESDICDDIIVVAWLHDIGDHKYDSTIETRNKMITFLDSIYHNKEKVEWILQIIEYISFSKEKKLRISNSEMNEKLEPLVWYNKLGDRGVLIRNIVSDADKLEALGEIGLKRCIEFTRHKNPNFSDEQIYKAVKEHADEKLLILVKDRYIRTPIGIYLAKKLEQDLKNGLDKLV